MARPTTIGTRTGDCVIPACVPAPPDKNHMFLDKRVCQGSSGRTCPLPLQAQEKPGPGNEPAARKILRSVLKRYPNHPPAADLWRDYFQQGHTP